MDYEVTDFATQVLKRSESLPVVVDFWAPWCGPCKTLGPVLESLAEENPDAWKLVKVNVDHHQELASAYQVRGIPAVKMVHGGQVIAEFSGALPAQAVRNWLEQFLPSAAKANFAQARQLLEQGDSAAARELLQLVLDDDPGHQGARVLLAREVLFDDPDRALELVKSIGQGTEFFDLAVDVRSLGEALTLSAGQLPESRARAALTMALAALGKRDLDGALEHFIASLIDDKVYLQGLARRACVALFNWLGKQHDLTRKYRRRFEMYLH